MTPAELDAMRATTARAAADPQPGDYWHEMLCAVALVVARRGGNVCVCRDKEDDGPRHFRFVNPRWMTVNQFRTWLGYGRDGGYWADCAVRSCRDVSSYAPLIPPLEVSA